MRLCRSMILLSFLLSVPVLGQTVSFVDETGSPATSYLEASRVWLRVEDPGANFLPYGVDTVMVQLTSSVETEVLSLSETGVDTGVFTGSMPLRYQGSGTPDALDTGASLGPPFARDTLTASYSTVTDTAGLVGSAVEILDSFGRPASGVIPSRAVRLRVRAPMRNDPMQIDTTQVVVNATGSGDQETAVLVETGYDTGLFEGELATSSESGTSPGDGALYLSPADQLTARHDDLDGPTYATATAAAVASTTDFLDGFLDGEGKPAPFVLESSRVNLQVVDLNAAFTTSVQVSSALTGDSETVQLTETGMATFRGSVKLALTGPGGGQPGNGVLETSEDPGPPHRFDTLTADHVDAGNGSSATATTFGSRIWFLDAFGEPTTLYASGTIAYVRVEDQNANDPTRFDRVTVQVLSPGTGDGELLELLEVKKDGGIFEGAIVLQDSWTASSGDGRLQGRAGGRIEAQHFDAYGLTASGAKADLADAEVDFIDEAGYPTAEVLEQGTARLRVISPLHNNDAYNAETLTLDLSSRYAGDHEAVSLTETGVNTGVFEGAIPLFFTSALQGNGTLETSNSGAPEYRGDELTASYGPLTAKAVTVTSRVVFLDGYGRETTTFVLRTLVRIRVTDPKSDYPNAINSIPVSLSVSGTNDQEQIYLTETGPHTGVFEGSIFTASGSGPAVDGVLQGVVGAVIEARRDDPTRPYPVVARATFTGSSLLFVDAAGQPATVYLEGDRVYVRLVAPQEGSPSLMVILTTELSQDLENLMLTNVAPGVYEGSIATRLAAGGLPNNGVIELAEAAGPPQEFDHLTVTRNDGYGPPATAEVGFTGSRTWFIDAYGAVTDSFPAGSRIYVRVEDHSQTDPSHFDRLPVQVRSLATGDTEVLELLETSKTSNVYEGSISQRDYPVAIAGDGVLQTSLGTMIEAERSDAGGLSTSRAQALIDFAGLDFVDEQGQPIQVLLENGTARLRLVRISEYDDPGQVETISVEMSSRYGGDHETLTLTETGPDTGIYEGSIALGFAAALPGNGRLETSDSRAPEYLGDELTASLGSLTAKAVTVTSRVVFIDGFGRETTTLPLGGAVGVRVVDYAAGTPQSIDTLPVSLSVVESGDGEIVILRETGFNTNVYEGSLPSANGNGSVGNGVLQGSVGATIEARRDSSSRPYPVVARARFAGSSVLFADAAGRPVSVYLEGERAYVRLVAPLESSQTLPVILTTELSQDLENLMLTNVAPGVFEGSIATRLAAGGLPNNDVIELSEAAGPPQEFDHLTVTRMSSYGPVTAQVGFLGSRTWFIDAYGAVTDSFPAGARIYVRVEDHSQTDPSHFDRLPVQVRSLATGDTEVLELLETTKTSNIYEGSIGQRDYPVAIAGDGVLQTSLGTLIEAERGDAGGLSSSRAQALIDFAGLDFVDEQGQPVTVLLENGTARVRLVRISDYDDPGQAETISVEMSSRYGGDQETLTLTETGPDTGIYEGAIALDFTAALPGNGRLETSNSGAPEYLGDELTASLGSLTAQAVTETSRVVFIDGFGRETTTLPLGGAVGVRVIDYTAGTPQSIDTLPVSLGVVETGDGESVTLRETGFNTGIYEGTLPSANGNGSAGDGVLQGQVWVMIEARRDSSSRPYPVVARARFSGPSLLFVDAAGQPVTVYLEGERARVRLLAPLESSPSVPVILTTELSQDLENLVLTNVVPGVYEGSIATRLAAGGLPNNDVIELSEAAGPPQEFDHLTVTRNDYYGLATVQVGFLGSRTWFIDAYGAVTDSFPAGARIHVRVEDHSQTDPSHFDRLPVQVRSLATGDTQVVELLETSKTSNIYEGSLDQRDYPLAVAGDGVLQTSLGTLIEAERSDAGGLSSSRAQALIDFAGLDFVDEQGQPVAVVLEKGTARVRLVRISDYDDPGQAEMISVEMSSRYGGDRETLTLTETGPDSGIYEGAIALDFAAALPGNGRLETSNSGEPEYLGDELTASLGSLTAQAVTVTSRVAFIDGFGRETTTIPLGGAVGVRVVDYTAANSPSIDTFSLSLGVVESGDGEYAILSETGFNTGVYEGSLPSAYGNGSAGSAGDGVLQGPVGGTIEARRDSSSRPYPVVARARFAGSSVLFVDAAGRPVSVYLEGERAYVRLVAPLESSPSLPVILTTELSLDLENLVLTSVAPGVYEGSIATRLAAGGQPNNDVIELSEAAGPPQEFDHLTVARYDGYAPVTAQVGFLGSRTWFIDAYGAVTDSFPVGSRIYVRVEDYSQTDPSHFDRLPVQVRSLATGDTQVVQLLETSKTSNIYEGSLDQRDYPVAIAGDGVLQTSLGTMIEAERSDAGGLSSSRAQALIDFAGLDFVDEQGQPVTVVLENGTARVRLVRISDYDDPGQAETISVEMSSRYGGDQETLTLTETGPDTGIYEGAIALDFTAALPGNGRLETSNSGEPEYLGDELTASLGSMTAQAVTVSSRVVFIDGFGRETPTFPLGGAVSVRVVDYTAGNSQSIDFFALSLGVVESGDGEYVTLQETGFNTSVYEGSLPSANGNGPAGSAGDGVLQGPVGGTIEARHDGLSRPYPVVARARFAGSSVLFVDAAGRPVSVYLEGERARVRLLAPLESSPSLPVILTTELSLDLENLVLTSIAPGVYEGSIATRLAAGGLPNNDVIELSEAAGPPQEFDHLTVTRNDGYGPVTAQVGFLGSRTWFIDAYGAVTESFPAGARIYVRVEDHSQTDPSHFDRLPVQVRSLATGDIQVVELLETSKTSNIYEGSLDQRDYPVPVAGDGVLQTSLGTRIEAERSDAGGLSSSRAEALIDFAGLDFVDEQGQPVTVLLENGTARVRLVRITDYDDPGQAETISVEMSSRYGGDQENLTLTETGPDTGIYEGAIALDFTAALPGNGRLETSNSGAPEYLGDELTASLGSMTAQAVTVTSRVVFIDGFGRESTTFPLGGAVGVRVVDHTLNRPELVDEATVLLDVVESGDSQWISLLETGYDTDVFQGSLPSAAGAPSPNDGVLQGQVGATIEARRDSESRPYPVVARASFAGSSVLFVDAAGQPATVYLEGDRVYVRLVAPQESSPSLPVILTTELSLDLENLVLTSSAPGIYEGSIGTRLAPGGQPNNDVIELSEAAGPPQELDHLTVTRNDGYNLVTARVGFTGSRTWFIDAYGAVTDSFPSGARIYVRVEDHSQMDPAQLDHLPVQVRSLATGDLETLDLVETAAASNVYEGSLAQRDYPVPIGGDGVLQTSLGTLIEAERQDAGGLSASRAQARIDYAGIDFIDAQGLPAELVLEKDTARVRVVRISDNDDPNIPDTLTVDVSSRYAGDQETLTLTENGADTGIYEGSIPLSFGGVQGNNILETANSGAPRYLGDELTASLGSLRATARTTPLRITFLDLLGREVTTYAAVRMPVRVRIEDHVVAGQLDSLRVPIQAPETGDSELVTLTETGPATGLFEGEVATSEDPSPADNGVLHVAHSAEVTHVGLITPALLVGRVTFQANLAPFAGDDAAEVVEGQSVTIDVLANDSDAEGTPLSVVALGPEIQGTQSINSDGTITYTAAAGYSGADTFTYVVEDAQGGQTRGTVHVTITPSNRPPTPVADQVETAEDQPVVISPRDNDTDPDNDPLDVVSITQPASGTAALNADDRVTYTPAPEFSGTASFSYTVRDPRGAEATSTVTIIVTPVDDPPVAVNDSATVTEDSGANAVNVLANDTDIDGEPMSIASVTQPANGTVVITGGGTGLTYQPNPNYCNTPPGTTLDAFTYTLTPGGSTATVTASVTCVDDQPTAVADTATVTEDAPATAIDVLANDTDPDGGPMSIASVTQPANGTVVITGGGTGVSYTPNANYCNTPPGTTLDTFTYTLTPGGSTATVSVSVACVDDNPTAVNDAATVTEGSGANAIDVLANDTDVDGGPKSIASVTQSANGTVVITGGGTGVSYTSNAGYCNTPPGTTLDAFTYTLTPGGSAATVTVSVTCVNDGPTVVADSAAVAEDGSVIIPVKANDSDPENDPLDVTAVTQGAHGTVTLNADDTVTYVPAANYNGPDAFSYTLSDGNGGTASATVTVTVTPVNDQPLAVNDSAATNEDTPVTIAVLGNDGDVDLDTLTITNVTQGTHGSVAISGQNVIYTPAAEYSGPDAFTYSISDGHGGTATASVSVSVAAVNDAPVAVNDIVTTAWNQSVTVPVLVNDFDVDGPSLTVTSVATSPYGTVTLNAGQTVTFTPNVQFVGLATFNYTVSDGAGGTATAQVRVTVQKPGRVTSGLQVLYDFEEGAGSFVNDVSGVGTPLRLTIANTANVTWVTGGLRVNSATTIQSATDATKVINAVTASNAITVEAWVAPANLTQSGPARILSIAQNSSKRDVLLGQDTNKFAAMLRTTTTGMGGGSLSTPAGGAASGLNHVIFTRDAAGNVTLYVSGTVSASGTMTGNLGNWQGYKLGVGNEIGGGAPWFGELHLVAVYSRALTATEVTQNLLAGAD